jgi:transposase-like protein
MSTRRTHSPEFKARVAMGAISGRKMIQEIAADHIIGMRDAAHPSVRPDPGEPMEAPAAGRRQRAVHQGHEDQGQGGGPGQGGRAVPADRTAADGAKVAQK